MHCYASEARFTFRTQVFLNFLGGGGGGGGGWCITIQAVKAAWGITCEGTLVGSG